MSNEMGIVKISEQMHDNLRTASNALGRSINAQAEHWMKVGMVAELYPQLCYADICQLLLRASQAGEESPGCSLIAALEKAQVA